MFPPLLPASIVSGNCSSDNGGLELPAVIFRIKVPPRREQWAFHIDLSHNCLSARAAFPQVQGKRELWLATKLYNIQGRWQLWWELHSCDEHHQPDRIHFSAEPVVALLSWATWRVKGGQMGLCGIFTSTPGAVTDPPLPLLLPKYCTLQLWQASAHYFLPWLQSSIFTPARFQPLPPLKASVYISNASIHPVLLSGC